MFVSNHPPVRLPTALYSQCKINAFASLCLRVNRASIACGANAAPSVQNEFKRRAVSTRALRASQPTRMILGGGVPMFFAFDRLPWACYYLFTRKKTFVSPATVATLARCGWCHVYTFYQGTVGCSIFRWSFITHLITESRLQTCLTSAATVCNTATLSVFVSNGVEPPQPSSTAMLLCRRLEIGTLHASLPLPVRE
jgi:hypothetical protein